MFVRCFGRILSIYLFLPYRFLCHCVSWNLEWIGKFKLKVSLFSLFLPLSTNAESFVLTLRLFGFS